MKAWSAALLLPLLSGCMGGAGGPTLYLEYTLENLGEPDRHGEFGPHCSEARFHPDRVEVAQREYEKLGQRRPFLVVQPDPAGFAAMGSGSFPLAMPSEIAPVLGAQKVLLLSVDHVDGRTLVDGETVDAPRVWRKEAPGDWRAEFRLFPGPERVTLYDLDVCW